MSKQIMTYQVNVVKRDMPVWQWLQQPLPLHRCIGGLLDYGYDRQQIIKMLGIPMPRLKSLMRHYGYKTIDKLKITYRTAL